MLFSVLPATIPKPKPARQNRKKHLTRYSGRKSKYLAKRQCIRRHEGLQRLQPFSSPFSANKFPSTLSDLCIGDLNAREGCESLQSRVAVASFHSGGGANKYERYTFGSTFYIFEVVNYADVCSNESLRRLWVTGGAAALQSLPTSRHWLVLLKFFLCVIMAICAQKQ